VRFFATKSSDNVNSRDSFSAEELASLETWKKIESTNIGNTYEVIMRMAGDIQKLSDDNQNVPIGILCCAQGGTEVAQWVSRDTILSGAFDAQEVNEYENNFIAFDGRWASHTDLYYDGIRSVMPYGVKAAVWYQGESDASSVSASSYDRYMKAMIDEFRVGMKNSDMPYIIVQLPGYVSGTWTEGTNPTKTEWAKMRLIQWNVAQQMDNVYAVVTNDSGDNGNIHPANKIVVGERLARTVLAKVFNQNIVCEGPVFDSVTYGVGSAAVTVDSNVGTLSKYDTVEGTNTFHLTDGTNWYTADQISISGNTINVSCSTMTTTVTGIRYAYGPEVIKCIYGSYTDGNGTTVSLPLAPFNTTYNYNDLN
ncbi:MAG: hypothetical protein IJ300_07390, partial [Clostridia bacterium]|nr:hypothetical protein [Clostridia bacterium]